MKTGDRAEITEELDLGDTVLREGELGTVVAVRRDPLGGVEAVEIRMDWHHPGLSFYENVCYLVDPELSEHVKVREEQQQHAWSWRYLLCHNAFRVAWVAAVIWVLSTDKHMQALHVHPIEGVLIAGALLACYNLVERRRYLQTT